jgi:acetyl esterase/lipase
MNGWRIAYGGLCAGSLAFASLTLFRAPTVWLWMASIVATEFGHCFFLGAATLFCAGIFGPRSCQLGALVALVAAGLFIRPLFQAWSLAGPLPGELAQAFGPLPAALKKSLPAPLSLGALGWGAKTPAVPLRQLVFAENGGSPLQLDFYPSQVAGASPCVIVIHSGGWNSGSPEEFLEFNSLLAQHGYAVAAIAYRLAPRWSWPAPREDVLHALRYLQAHAAELGLDPQRFVLLGRSAGGQIAEAVAYTAHDPAIRGCIAFYAPADLELAFRYADPEDILNTYKLLVDYLGGTLAQVPANYADASAILQVTAASPPTLLLHGQNDPLVWNLQSRRLAARLGEAGVPHYFLDLPWATHAFDYNPRSPGGQLSAYAVLYFLAAITGGSSAPPP